MPQTREKLSFLRLTVEQHPEYREILPIFMQLYGAIEGHEGETGISFATPVCLGAERISGGFPLVAPEMMQVNEEKAASFLAAVIDALLPVVKESVEDLNLLKDFATSGVLKLHPLLVACLSRDRKVLDEAATPLGVATPLLEFALEPLLKTGMEAFAETVAPEMVEGWQEGYCPICGSRAGMSELTGEEGKRQLCCSTCFYKWPYQRMKCPYCNNEDTASLSYFLVGEGPTRVDLCRKCSRYVKTRDTRRGNAGIPLDAQDLATIHLDLLASKEGFVRAI